MYCRNCGKPISSIVNECPHCKTQVNENNYQQTNQKDNDNSNNVLYHGMNGKPVTILKVIVGIILMVIGLILI